jgi:hypothetical protein
VDRVRQAIREGKTRVIDLDLRSYFDNVRHNILLAKLARRIEDRDVLHLLKLILAATGAKGVPQGGVISPLLSNVYLNEVDRMLERAKEVTREGEWTRIQYARFADDLVVLVDGQPPHERLLRQVDRRLHEELAKLEVEVNEEKSRAVDLVRGDSFGFLGFDIRRVRSRSGRWFALAIPIQFDRPHNPWSEACRRAVCGKSAGTVRSGGGRKRAHGTDQTGTKPETADTAKSAPTEYRAGPRPYLRNELSREISDLPPARPPATGEWWHSRETLVVEHRSPRGRR